MAKRRGRPSKTDDSQNSKQILIDAAVKLIKEQGADFITVRKLCSEADLSVGTFYHYFKDKDDLLMYFIQEISFKDCVLLNDISCITQRIIELYMKLVKRYMELGVDFMKCFYTTSNKSLSAYLSEIDRGFSEGAVMARCEKELSKAQAEGYILKEADTHHMTSDICTIVKGCIFDWCLTGGKSDLKENVDRIVKAYFLSYTTDK